MAKDVYLVNTCDAWKSYSSFQLVGIFITRKALNPVLNKMIKQGDIYLDSETSKKTVNNLSDKELDDYLSYISIQKITLNEVQ